MRPESARDGSRGLPRRVRGTCHPVGVLRRASGPLPGRPGDPRGAGINYSRGPGSPNAPGPMPHLYIYIYRERERERESFFGYTQIYLLLKWFTKPPGTWPYIYIYICMCVYIYIYMYMYMYDTMRHGTARYDTVQYKVGVMPERFRDFRCF